MALLSKVENRKAILVVINCILMIASLILIGTGASLMGFYRIHLLDVIAIDFLIVPIIMTGSGVLTLIIFMTGMTAIAKDNASWFLVYSILTAINFFVLLAGVISSVRLIVEIQIGFLNAEVIPELSRYETESWIRYKWDTIQSEFMCCGGYGHHQGYTDWKHTFMGDSKKSVPDSCCLFDTPGCGQNLFEITDIRVIVQKINIHGCLFVMKKRLDTQVTLILIIFAGCGSILAISELFTLVLSCCLKNSNFSDDDDDENIYESRNDTHFDMNIRSHGTGSSINSRYLNEEQKKYLSSCESKCL